MELRTMGPLRARIARSAQASGGGSGPLVVLLHGFGAPGDDLAALADLVPAPPGTTWIFPEALHDLAEFAGPAYRGSRAWWMIDVTNLDRMLREDPPGLAEARAAVVAMLEAVARDASIASGPLVLGGFSQGAMVALDVALREPLPLAGVVQLSGTFLAADAWTPRMRARAGLPVFQSHGTDDPLLPFALAEDLRDALRAAGLDVTFERFDGGHAIPPSTLTRLGEWLGRFA